MTLTQTLKSEVLSESISALGEFKLKLRPWFEFVQNFNKSFAKHEISPISVAPVDLKDAGLAAWQMTESQVEFLIKILQDFETNNLAMVVEVFRTTVAIALNLTGGIFSSLILLSLELLVGFICIVLDERYFHRKSETFPNI